MSRSRTTTDRGSEADAPPRAEVRRPPVRSRMGKLGIAGAREFRGRGGAA